MALASDDMREQERQRLFKATLAVMRRNGDANATVAEILTEAGLGTRAFYRHFGSKDELLLALFRSNAEITRHRLDERVAAATHPPAQVVAWIDELLDIAYDERRGRVALLFASEATRAAFGDAGDVAAAELYAPLEQVLVAGAASGEFPTCDPPTDAASIHALVWRFFWAAIHGRPLLEREAAREHVLRFVLPALGVEVR